MLLHCGVSGTGCYLAGCSAVCQRLQACTAEGAFEGRQTHPEPQGRGILAGGTGWQPAAAQVQYMPKPAALHV